MDKTVQAFERFLETIKTLRSPHGCPWDKDQTPLSMRQALIEETFEAVDAITVDDSEHAKEELGDVLLNVMMISLMYEQQGSFSICDSLNELSDKLIRRHPHVWPESAGSVEAKKKAENSDEVLNQWDRIKQNVEGRKGKSILDEVPEGFPPMLRAYKLQKKAGKKGFEWKTAEDVLPSVKEELDEVISARKDFLALKEKLSVGGCEAKPLTVNSPENQDEAQLHVEEEIGDLLFAVVNYARKLDVDPETALSRTNKKFYNRFTYIERKMEEKNIPMDGDHLEEEEKLWDEAKKLGM